MNEIHGAIAEDGNDVVRGHFTVYLEKLVRHAKIDYVRKNKRQIKTVSLENISPSMLAYEPDWQSGTAKSAFDFAEQKLSDAFSDLPLLRQQILEFIFIHGLSAQEVSIKMNCSVDYVYKQKHLALKKLRDRLINGGGDFGEE